LRAKEEADRVSAFEAQKIKDDHMRQINAALDRLKQEQQKRAYEVLRELSVRGVKTIGKDRI